MAELLTRDDLTPLVGPDADLEMLDVYIDDVEAQAVAEVPCLAAGLPEPQASAAKAILRQAVLRWWRVGEGGVQQVSQTAGPFSQATTYSGVTRGEGRLFESELKRLQRLCPETSDASRRGGARPAFTIRPRLK